MTVQFHMYIYILDYSESNRMAGGPVVDDEFNIC